LINHLILLLVKMEWYVNQDNEILIEFFFVY
jgi:hypothetical protein